MSEPTIGELVEGMEPGETVHLDGWQVTYLGHLEIPQIPAGSGGTQPVT